MSETAGRNRLDAIIPVRFADAREFLVEYSSNISMGGVFVRTSSPAAFGSVVRLSLELPGSGQSLPVTGQVAFVLAPDEAARQGKVPGMGVRFSRLDPVVQEALSSYVNGLQQKSKGRVLLVDDDPLILQQLSDALRRYHLNVVTASNAIKALEVIRFGGIDFIISDIQMPRMDGFEFRDNLRGNPKTTNIPFIFLTSSMNDGDRQIAAELGVQHFLPKPYQEEHIISLLRQVLGEEAFAEAAAAPPPAPPAPPAVTVRVPAPTQQMPAPVISAPAPATPADPAVEKARQQQQRAVEIAYRKFVSLGLDTRVSEDQSGVFGQLVLRTVNIQDPATGQRLERAGFYSVGHDRAKPFWPRALGALPFMKMLDLPDAAALERALGAAYAARMEYVRGSKSFLDRLKIENRYDPQGLRVLGRIADGENQVVFSFRDPKTVFLETVNNRSFGVFTSLAQRLVDVSHVRTASDLEIAIGNVCHALQQAIATPAERPPRAERPPLEMPPPAPARKAPAAAAPAPAAAPAAPLSPEPAPAAIVPPAPAAPPPLPAVAAPAPAQEPASEELLLGSEPTPLPPQPEPPAPDSVPTEEPAPLAAAPVPPPTETPAWEEPAPSESAPGSSAPVESESAPESSAPAENADHVEAPAEAQPFAEAPAAEAPPVENAPASGEDAPAWSPSTSGSSPTIEVQRPMAEPEAMETVAGATAASGNGEAIGGMPALADAWSAVEPASGPGEAADWGETPKAEAPPPVAAPAAAPVAPPVEERKVARTPGTLSDFLAAIDAGAPVAPIPTAPDAIESTPHAGVFQPAPVRPAPRPADDAARAWADEWNGDETNAQPLWTVQDHDVGGAAASASPVSPGATQAVGDATTAPVPPAPTDGSNSTVLVCNNCGQYYSIGEDVDDERLLLMCPACIARGG